MLLNPTHWSFNSRRLVYIWPWRLFCAANAALPNKRYWIHEIFWHIFVFFSPPRVWRDKLEVFSNSCGFAPLMQDKMLRSLETGGNICAAYAFKNTSWEFCPYKLSHYKSDVPSWTVTLHHVGLQEAVNPTSKHSPGKDGRGLKLQLGKMTHILNVFWWLHKDSIPAQTC